MSDSREEPRGPGRPAHTSREEIVAAALELSQSVGFSGLSLRLVAEQLNISPMAIYRHVADKRALLEAAADAAMSEVVVPPIDETDPLGSLREIGIRLRRVLLRYPGAAGYALAHGPVWPSALRITERSLEALRTAGYKDVDVARAYVAFAHFVIGRTHLETSFTTDTSGEESTVEEVHPRLGSVTLQEFDLVAASVESMRSLTPERQFSYELHLLLDGLRAELRSKRG